MVKNIKKGQYFNKSNIRKIRPGHGVSPIFYEKILGKKSFFNIKAYEPLTKKNLIKNKIYLKYDSFR